MRVELKVWAPVLLAVLALMAAGSTVRADYVSTLTSMNGLVSYWDLNETSGTIANDAITTDGLDAENDGTYSGAGVTLGNAGPRPSDGFLGFSTANCAPTFADDANTKLQMAVHSVYAGLTDVSIITWVRYPTVPASKSDRRTVGGLQVDEASNKYVLATGLYNPSPAGLQQFTRRSDSTVANLSRYEEGAEEWHMWVATFDDGQICRSYLDGALKETYTFATGPLGLYTPGGLIFGNDIQVTANRPWKGELDEIAIFNRGLSEAEVEGLWTVATTGIPEPASLVLLAAGVVCLAVSRRRHA